MYCALRIVHRGQWFVQAAKEAAAAKAASDAKAAADKVGTLRISLAAVSAICLRFWYLIGHCSAMFVPICYVRLISMILALWYR